MGFGAGALVRVLWGSDGDSELKVPPKLLEELVETNTELSSTLRSVTRAAAAEKSVRAVPEVWKAELSPALKALLR